MLRQHLKLWFSWLAAHINCFLHATNRNAERQGAGMYTHEDPDNDAVQAEHKL